MNYTLSFILLFGLPMYALGCKSTAPEPACPKGYWEVPDGWSPMTQTYGTVQVIQKNILQICQRWILITSSVIAQQDIKKRNARILQNIFEEVFRKIRSLKDKF